MRLRWRHALVTAVLFGVTPCWCNPGTLQSVSAFFSEYRGVYFSHGSRTSIELRAGEIRIGPLVLRHLGAAPVQPKGASRNGTVRIYSAGAEQTRPLSHAVEYEDLYPGILLRASFTGHVFKTDYIIRPGSDPALIHLKYDNAVRVETAAGELILTAADGARIEQPAPVAYQERADGLHAVPVSFDVQPDETVRFQLGEYDPALPVIIDPYVVSSAAYYGGSGIDKFAGLAADSNANLYAAGSTDSSDFLAAPAAGQDAFVLKLNSSNQVIWATYLRGSDFDSASALAVDSVGQVYITGFTNSTDFPNTSAAFAANSGGRDSFLAKVRSDGSLAFSTYLGGTAADSANGISLGVSNDVWIAGETSSTNFPAVAAYQAVAKGGTDAFISRFSTTGALLSSTYLGGSGDDRAMAIAVNATGVYVTGGTTSVNFPTSAAAFPNPSGFEDAFVAKLNASAASLAYSTYLGGSGGTAGNAEVGNSIAVDTTGSAFVAGVTSSANFPVLAPVTSSFQGGATDGFLARFAANGALLFSTFLGGAGSDEATTISLHPDGSVYVAGSTTSPDLRTIDAVQTQLSSSGKQDGFVLRLNSSLSSLLFQTYLGGVEADAITGLALNGSDVYVAGYSSSPVLFGVGGWKGMIDAFITRLRQTQSTIPVTIAANVPGPPFSVTGSGCGAGDYVSSANLIWTVGASCTITVNTLYTPAAGIRQKFTGWSDGFGSSVRTILVGSTQANLTIQFATEYRLTQLIVPAGTGTVLANPASSDGYYSSGATVSLTPAPAAGYRFVNWTGDYSGSANPGTVNMSAVRTVTANFACTFNVSQTSLSYSDAATSTALTVTAGAGCSWTATSGASWISIASGAAGTGSGTVQIAIASNTLQTSRTATLSIAGIPVTITQAAPPPVICAYSTDVSSLALPAAGGSGSVSVATSAACSWTVTSQASWISVPSQTRTGSGTISYQISANGAGLRTGTITLGGKVVTITQAGPGPNYPPDLQDVVPFAGTGMDQTFTATYTDANGWSDIARAYLVFNLQINPAAGCYLEYDRSANQVRLYDDAGVSWLGPVTLGSSATLQNSQCRLNAADSSWSGSGATLTVRLSLSFKPGFNGKRNLFLSAQDASGSTVDWLCFGAWWVGNVTGVPVNRYRLYNPYSSSHLHTTDLNEYNTLATWGFVQEGISGRIYNAPATVSGVSVAPLYRIYNAPGIRHFWTADRNEYLTLIRLRGIYLGEGIDGFIFNSPANGTIPMYRLVYKFAAPVIHHWTTDAYEYKVLGESGAWQQEGIAAYMLPVQ